MLLLVLLLEANKVVAVDRLVDAVWEGSPPATAQKALHVHVSRLRKLLGRERLETISPGYRLRVEPGELDVASFEQLWYDGRLVEALALWRGPPLPDLAYHELGQKEIGRLEEQRLRCLEERLDADLAAGAHDAIVVELEALVREQPLREGLRSRLMLALYRAHRQADALRVYQQSRALLVDELGIEPSRALRELHRRILEQDPALDAASAPAPSAKPVGAPREVAPDVALNSRKTVTTLATRVAVVGMDGAGVDPEVQRQVSATAFAEVELAVSHHGGSVESSTSDTLSVVFGLPVVHEDDGLRAVRAAAEASVRLLALAEQLGTEAKRGIEWRIGISTGRIVTGGPTLARVGRPVLQLACGFAMPLRRANC